MRIEWRRTSLLVAEVRLVVLCGAALVEVQLEVQLVRCGA